MTEPLMSELSLSVGQQLKQAREKLNLSIDDVAAKTNLKKSHIESLEDDIFILPSIPPAFVRGYMRNYVRFLRLPDSLISAVNYGEVTIPKSAQKVKIGNIKSTHRSQGRWIKYATVAVLLGAVGMTLTWWWQDYQKEQQVRESTVNLLPSEGLSDTQHNDNAATSGQLVLNHTMTESAPSLPLSNENSTLSDAVVIDAPVAKTAENSMALAPNADTTVANSTFENSAPQVMEQAPEQVNILHQMNESANAASTIEGSAADTPSAVNNDELRIEISGGNSWISIRSKNRRLVDKLYTDGETLTFNDNEQYRLTIGAPAYVKVYYKGEQVPMKIDGRVARFKLPLNQ